MQNRKHKLLENGAIIFEEATINLLPIPTSATARKANINLKPDEIGANTIVYPGAVIYAGVKIGKNCLICSNTVIRESCVIGDNTIISNGVTLNYNAHIGNNVKILDNTHITGGMIVEDDVFISCLVATTNDNTIGRRNGEPCHPPIVRKRARIGSGVNILPGVVIGENAIVAAGAVVTKDVRKGAKVFGIPAREK
jgi:acetyltransferase-like isoleucine patch superfamily enzyme